MNTRVLEQERDQVRACIAWRFDSLCAGDELHRSISVNTGLTGVREVAILLPCAHL